MMEFRRWGGSPLAAGSAGAPGILPAPRLRMIPLP